MVKDETLLIAAGAAFLYFSAGKQIGDTVGGVATGVKGIGTGVDTAFTGLGQGISDISGDVSGITDSLGNAFSAPFDFFTSGVSSLKESLFHDENTGNVTTSPSAASRTIKKRSKSIRSKAGTGINLTPKKKSASTFSRVANTAGRIASTAHKVSSPVRTITRSKSLKSAVKKTYSRVKSYFKRKLRR